MVDLNFTTGRWQDTGNAGGRVLKRSRLPFYGDDGRDVACNASAWASFPKA